MPLVSICTIDDMGSKKKRGVPRQMQMTASSEQATLIAYIDREIKTQRATRTERIADFASGLFVVEHLGNFGREFVAADVLERRHEGLLLLDASRHLTHQSLRSRQAMQRLIGGMTKSQVISLLNKNIDDARGQSK